MIFPPAYSTDNLLIRAWPLRFPEVGQKGSENRESDTLKHSNRAPDVGLDIHVRLVRGRLYQH